MQPEDLQALVQLRMPFGKHKDMLLATTWPGLHAKAFLPGAWASCWR